MFRLRWKTQRRTNPIVRKTFDTEDELENFLEGMAPHMLQRMKVWKDGERYPLYTGSGQVR